MSSGGQNSASMTGPQGMRICDASDVTTQTKLELTYMTNNQSNSGYLGVNAYRSKGIQNSCDFLLQVQRGLRECGVSSNGIRFTPLQGPIGFYTSGVSVGSTGPTGNYSVTVNSTIPTKP